MSREEAIKTLLEESTDKKSIEERLDRIEKKFDLILSVLVVQQKDACEAMGVSDDTVRNKVLRGEVEILQRDGSRLNFLTLADAGELKKRKHLRRRK